MKATQGHRLMQLGVVLFLGALLIGLAVPRFAVPRLGLSAHLAALMQGVFLVVLGLVWPRLALAPAASRAGFWLAAYGALAPLTANLLAATWGAGNVLLPLAAGPARGTPLQEQIIAIGLRSGGAAEIAVTLMVLWGLRAPPGD